MSFIVKSIEKTSGKVTFYGPCSDRTSAIECAKNICSIKSNGKGNTTIQFDETAGVFSITYSTPGWVRNTYHTVECIIEPLVNSENLKQEMKKQEEELKKSLPETPKTETPKSEETKPEEPKSEETKVEESKVEQDKTESVVPSTTEQVVEASKTI